MSDIPLEPLTARLRRGDALLADEASEAARALGSADVPDVDKRAFLLALSERGETATEVGAFAKVFRDLAKDPGVHVWAPHAIDVCGTGGDHSGSFNVSTTVGFILAAGGVPVFKHGNRSVTSKCGSADLLAALGVPMEADNALLQRSLDTLRFAFFFAPAFHPAFANVANVRRSLAAEGRRTIFNLLGPLINPGRPAHQLLGVFSPQWVRPMAEALHRLGLRRALAVHCRLESGRGLDELSCAGSNIVAGAGQLDGMEAEWRPQDYLLGSCAISDLAGGSLQDNLSLLNALAAGRAPAGLEDTVVFNAGAAFYVAGRQESVLAGVVRARDIVRGGALATWLRQLRDFYAA